MAVTMRQKVPFVAGQLEDAHDHSPRPGPGHGRSPRPGRSSGRVRSSCPALHRAERASRSHRRARPSAWGPRTSTGRTRALSPARSRPRCSRTPAASFVLVGHSERRHLFGETDESVSRKVRAALQTGLSPIVCVGESLEEREARARRWPGSTTSWPEGGLAGLSQGDIERIVVAYEPVWAIGTGRTATPGQAEEVHAHIRKRVEEELWKSDRLLCYNPLRRLRQAGQRCIRCIKEKDIDGFLGRGGLPRRRRRSSASSERPFEPTGKRKRSERYNHHPARHRLSDPDLRGPAAVGQGGGPRRGLRRRRQPDRRRGPGHRRLLSKLTTARRPSCSC